MRRGKTVTPGGPVELLETFLNRSDEISLHRLLRDTQPASDLGVSQAVHAIEKESIPACRGQLIEYRKKPFQTQFPIHDRFRLRRGTRERVEIRVGHYIARTYMTLAQIVHRRVRGRPEQIGFGVPYFRRIRMLEKLHIRTLGDLLHFLRAQPRPQKPEQGATVPAEEQSHEIPGRIGHDAQ